MNNKNEGLIGFISDRVKGKDLDKVDQFNEALRRLSKRRKTEIVRKGDFASAKLAWRVAIFQQSLLYRTVMLGVGTADAWNKKNSLAAILCVRASMETCAFIIYVVKKLRKLCDEGDFKSLNELMTKATFGTRLKAWKKEGLDLSATNVLTCIQDLNKKLPGVEAHYEALSEFCHPNYLGNLFSFGKIDKDTGKVEFSDFAAERIDIFSHIFTAMQLIPMAEIYLNDIDKLMPRIIKISDLDKAKKSV